MELIDFMNVLYGNLEDRFKKFQVYNVPTMGADDFMVLFLFFSLSHCKISYRRWCRVCLIK